MIHAKLGRAFLFLFLSGAASAQIMSIPSSGFGEANSSPVGMGLISSEQMMNNQFLLSSDAHRNQSALQTPSGSVSKLDLKAPWKAKREYDKGYQLMMRRDFTNAVQHLGIAIAEYPKFVAAHNALGSAYLSMGQNEQARDEFTQAVALDDHLPNSYLNLGCAELALKNYPAAEDSIQKASAIAPLDLQLLMALAYGQFMNHNYPAVIATANQVHSRKHENAAVVHYFAAGALEAQNNLPDAQTELETLLREDPKSSTAEQARQSLKQIKEEREHPVVAEKPAPAEKFSFVAPADAAEQAARQGQQTLQDLKEKSQIAEAEAEPKSVCPNCAPPNSSVPGEAASRPVVRPKTPLSNFNGPTIHSSVDEVAVFFAATDHGKPVTNLTRAEVGIRDDRKAPEAIRGFRNEAQLPLRLGLVIDTSDSVNTRFNFEQSAATNFLQQAVPGKDDLSFVVGVANSVLLVQDFTPDQKLASHAVGQLVPSGGTALWDAVAFASDKLASRPEVQPVARVLVVISDGQDNSSSVTLKEAIERAQHGEVAIYTVSTRDFDNDNASAALGEHALKTLAELTGGAAFTPGSVRRLKSSLGDLQQVVRSRYLVSYKPASFQRDGQYRTIEIAAQKDGHKLRVYARKGYYAGVVNSETPTTTP